MVTILALGDATLRTRDGADPFPGIKALADAADFVVVNLENVIARKGGGYEPAEKAFIEPAYADELAWLDGYREKFVFTLANNHVFDLGRRGYEDTAEFLGGRGFGFVRPDSVLDVEKNGVRLRFHAACPGLRGDAGELPETSAGPGAVDILSIHWGAENVLLPSPRQLGLARSLHRRGFDVILGHHSHTPQGSFLGENKFCVFSLGNCNMKQSGKERPAEKIGLAVRLSIGADGGIAARKIPLEFDGNYAPRESRDPRVVSFIEKLDSILPRPGMTPAGKLKYGLGYRAHMSGIYLKDNLVFGWIPRVKKYGGRHLLMMGAWLFSRDFLLSLFMLPFHRLSGATRLMKEIDD